MSTAPDANAPLDRASAAAPPVSERGSGGVRRQAGGGRGDGRQVRRRTNQRVGRPLQAMERNTIMGIWSQLNPNARRALWETLGGMLGETPALPPAGGTAVQNTVESARPTRERVWDREILRDVPLFAEFGHMTAAQRRADSRNIQQLLSIATGVVKRGREQGVPAAEITRALVNTSAIGPDAMRVLYAPAEAAEQVRTGVTDEATDQMQE